MCLIDSARSLYTQSVTVAPDTGEKDTYGNPVYGTAKTYACRVVNRYRKVIDSNGRETVASATITLRDQVSIGITDKVTLPTGESPILLGIEAFPCNVPNHRHTRLVL